MELGVTSTTTLIHEVAGLSLFSWSTAAAYTPQKLVQISDRLTSLIFLTSGQLTYTLRITLRHNTDNLCD
jgi:hypothetical protein